MLFHKQGKKDLMRLPNRQDHTRSKRQTWALKTPHLDTMASPIQPSTAAAIRVTAGGESGGLCRADEAGRGVKRPGTEEVIGTEKHRGNVSEVRKDGIGLNEGKQKPEPRQWE